MGYRSSEKFSIFHCGMCNTAFAAPLKVDASIYNCIYQKAREVPGYDRYYDYAEKVLQVERPLDFLAEAEDVYWGIRSFLNKKGLRRILEVGCGFGYLTFALAKAGHRVKGIDISNIAVENASKKYGEGLFECVDVRELAEREGPVYDLIIFTEVIEHIENIKEFMRAVDALLVPGGNLLLTTPNKTPYPEDVLWETEPPPVHLFWFSEDSMRVLAKFLKHRVTFVDFRALNLLEYQTKGDFFRPYVCVREFLPSRLPRLDAQGNVLHTGHFTSETTHATEGPPRYPLDAPKEAVTLSLAEPVPVPQSGSRELLKKILRALGLLPLLKKIRQYFRHLKAKRIENAARRERYRKLMHFYNTFPSKRPTMCAIFTKRRSFRFF